MDLYAVVGAVLTLLISNFAIAKKISDKIKVVSKEVGDLFVVLFAAFEDGKITGDELKKIADEADDIPRAIKDLLKKK